MSVSNERNDNDKLLLGLKVVLKRYPFNDCTNNFLMPVKRKCDVKDMKTSRQNSKKNKQSEKKIASDRKSLKNRNNDESADGSTHTIVPEVLKDCKVIFGKQRLSEVIRGCKVVLEKTKIPEVKSCKVILERTFSDQKLQNDVAPIEKRIRSSTSLVNRLRKCDEINYYESSLEFSTVEPSKTENTNTPGLKLKIPIYQQNIEKSEENEKDPYELDISDSDGYKPKPKRAKNLNNSRKFNKTMYDLLEKLDKKGKRVDKKIISNNNPNYEDKVKGVLKKVMTKVNARKKDVTEVIERNGTKYSTASAILNPRNVSVVADNFLGFGNSNAKSIPNQEKNLRIPIASSQGYKNGKAIMCEVDKIKEQPKFIESINGYECQSGFLGFDNKNTHLKSTTAGQPNNINVIDLGPANSQFQSDDDQNDCYCENDSNDEYFGFGEVGEDDVNSHKTIESPAFFSCHRPNANSTMVGGAPKSPWRLSIPGKRNNYFLLIKSNSLPRLNQEMVLDHSVIEESEHMRSRSEEVEKPKSPIQTSILDFVEGSEDHHSYQNLDNMRRSSLFDHEDFIDTRPRRKILGVLQQNVLGRKQTESTPRKEQLNQIGSPDLSAVGDLFYGFDRTDDECRENHEPSSRPFRIDIRDIRQYKNVQGRKEAELSVVEETVVEQSELMEEQDVTKVDEIHIFEDYDSKQEMEMSIKLPSITYGRKRRRKRLLSTASDEANEEKSKKKKKKKDMMTNAELDAFEKWAQGFNSMCKEVDEHQLEIE